MVSAIESSAGTFSYLKGTAWPKLKASLPDEDGLPWDLSEAFLNSMESLMLAQAQECVWQWAVMGMITGFGSVLIRLCQPQNPGRNSNGTIAKLAAKVGHRPLFVLFCCAYSPLLKVSALYDNARSAIHDAGLPISNELPSVSGSVRYPLAIQPKISYLGVECPY